MEYENEFDRFADDVKYRLEEEGILNKLKVLSPFFPLAKQPFSLLWAYGE